MKRFTHLRHRGRLTSACEACGETFAGLSEAAVFRWQRDHKCTTDKET